MAASGADVIGQRPDGADGVLDASPRGHLKHTLVREADERLARQGGWGVLLLTLLAVSREGSETVVFLYGAGARLQGRR
jgi:high-affinity Fe2+/Pb2+ permease